MDFTIVVEIYMWIGVTFGLIVFLWAGIEGLNKQTRWVILIAPLSGILFGMVWPVLIWLYLEEEQNEYGRFFRPKGWRPYSLRVLDTLRHDQEMSLEEIVVASRGAVHERGIHIVLERLAKEGYLTAREIDPLEPVFVFDPPILTIQRRFLYTLTTEGMARRLGDTPLTRKWSLGSSLYPA